MGSGDYEYIICFLEFIITHIFTIFKYFAKQTIYSDSSDHVLQNDIQHEEQI